MVFVNLPNLTRSVDRINDAFNESFVQKVLDGKFLIDDLFNETKELRKTLLASGMPPDIMEDLLNGSFNLSDLYETFNQTIDIEPFCRESLLNNLITIDNSTRADELVKALCNLNVRKFTMDLSFFLNEIQPDILNAYVSEIELSPPSFCTLIVVREYLSFDKWRRNRRENSKTSKSESDLRTIQCLFRSVL